MSNTIDELIRRAGGGQMTSAQKDQQRESFAYGNTKIENDMITRETVINQAKLLGKRQ